MLPPFVITLILLFTIGLVFAIIIDSYYLYKHNKIANNRENIHDTVNDIIELIDEEKGKVKNDKKHTKLK